MCVYQDEGEEKAGREKEGTCKAGERVFIQ